MKRNTIRCLCVGAMLGMALGTPPALAGHWQLQDVVEVGSIKKCETGYEDIVQGYRFKLFAGSRTTAEIGRWHTATEHPYWTHHRVILPPMPERLDPGQNFQVPLGIQLVQGPSEVAVWAYRVGADQLGLFSSKGSGNFTTKPYKIPDHPAVSGDLRLSIGGGFTGGFVCDFVYRYAWVNQSSPDPKPKPKPEDGTPTNPDASGLEQTIDRPGSDFRQLTGIESAAACRDQCAGVAACKAFSWVRPGAQGAQAVCYLKNGVPPATASTCCISGVVRPTNPGPDSSNSSSSASSPSSSSQQTTAKACPDKPAQLELQACKITAAQGTTVRVPIYLLASADLANLNFEIRYDSAIATTAGKAEKGPLLGGQVLFDSNLGQAGVARIGFAGSSGVSGSGILAHVPFKVVGAAGSSTKLELRDTAANTTANARPAFALAAGEIVVTAGQEPSDGTGPSSHNPPVTPNPPVDSSDQSKVFTALDALKALQMSVGLLSPDMAYDLDKTGQITSNDARLILGRAVRR